VAGAVGTPGEQSAGVADDSGLTRELVLFCRVLRARGLLVSPAESIDAARVLPMIDVGDRADVRLALRALLTAKPGDLAVFDAAFDELWPTRAAPEVQMIRGPQVANPRAPTVPVPRTPAQAAAPATLERWARATEEMDEDTTLLRLPSGTDARRRPSFATFDAGAMRDAVRVARRVARRLAARPSRRWQPTTRGPRLDLRRTVRAAMRTGGELSTLVYRRRALRRTKLLVLCDVSGSMDLYVRPLLQFLFALQHSFARVETFVFATRLSRITTDLRAMEYGEALSRIAAHVDDWNGGTRIGESLAAFAADWLRLVDRRTVVLVLSDGWDTGEPAKLAEAMAAIRRRAGRIIWLNPLLADPRYEPRARGMQAALPYIDVFASAHDLASLEALAGHLSL
jgi:uncharacterized protein